MLFFKTGGMRRKSSGVETFRMGIIEINWKPEREDLRKFARAMFAGFGFLGLIIFLRSAHQTGWRDFSVGTLPLALWIAGLAAGLLCLTGSKAALPVYWTFMGFAFLMGNVISRILLALFFYGIITPMGFCMRLAGRDRLALRRPQVGSYWRDVSDIGDKSRFERQF
jgi:hypothetical protein